ASFDVGGGAGDYTAGKPAVVAAKGAPDKQFAAVVEKVEAGKVDVKLVAAGGAAASAGDEGVLLPAKKQLFQRLVGLHREDRAGHADPEARRLDLAVDLDLGALDLELVVAALQLVVLAVLGVELPEAALEVVLLHGAFERRHSRSSVINIV